MVEVEVKCPLRPTLLVISAARDYEGRSLAERAGRQYAENMRRLTQKFSQRYWNIAITDINDENALGDSWLSLEESNMAILTGYTGTPEENNVLAKLAAAANPLATLVNLGGDLTGADLSFFKKSISLLSPALAEQFTLTAQVLKETRKENTAGKWDPDKARGMPACFKPQHKTIN